MIEIAVVACLLSEPTNCKNIEILTDYPSVVACQIFGQMQIAPIMEKHEGWKVEGFTCREAPSWTEDVI